MDRQHLEETMRRLCGLHFAKLEPYGGGTTPAIPMRVTGFIKLCSTRQEEQILRRLLHTLGNVYERIFPHARVMAKTTEGYFIELEYLGQTTFEDFLDEKVSFSDERCAKIIGLVQDSLSIFAKHQAPDKTQLRCTNRFRAEVVDALLTNNKAAGFDVEITSMKHVREKCSFIATICHRDLSVGNIMCENEVRLIDPRPLLPGALKTSPMLYGSIACDCAMLAVSLERKHMERKRMGHTAITTHVESFNTFIAQCVAHHLFSREMYLLCKANAYAIYAACKCTYCLAPERAPLYNHMCHQLHATLTELVEKQLVRVTTVPTHVSLS